MAASRVDRIQKLAAGLAAMRPEPAAPEPEAPPATPPAAPPLAPSLAPSLAAPPRPRGRPRTDTAPLNLRMPIALRDRAAVEAGRRSVAERRNVTPQAVILELLEAHLPHLPPEAPPGTPPKATGKKG